MKKFTSLILVFTILCTLSQPVIAVENPMFSNNVVGTIDTSIRFADQSTLAVTWRIQANQPGLTLNNTQGLRLAYDNTILQLIRWDADSAYADSSIGTSFATQSGAGNRGAYDSDILRVYAAKNTAGDTGYINLTVGDEEAAYNCMQGVYVPLVSVRFAFREGKSAEDLAFDSIRTMTVLELWDFSVSTGSLINAYSNGNPYTVVSYEYLTQHNGVPIEEDTLNAPTISLPVVAQNARAPVINTQPVGDTVFVDATHNLTVEASSPDGGTLSYQWYSNNSETNCGGMAITGAANATYAAPTSTAGTYYYYVVVTNTITNKADGGLTAAAIASNAITLIVNTPLYSVTLSETDAYVFPTVEEDYTEQTTRNIIITNTGNRPTGALTIALGGMDANAFSLSKTNVESLAVDGTSSFTVTPRMWLAAGIYNATVTVSGDNGISTGFNISFTVSEAPKAMGSIWIAADKTEVQAGDQVTFTITLTNDANAAAAWKNVVAIDKLSSLLTYVSSRVVTGSSVSVTEVDGIITISCGDIAVGAVVIVEITVRVSDNAKEGDVINNIIVGKSTNHSDVEDTETTQAIEEEPTYGISLSESGTYTFPTAIEGYPAQTARTVTIYNTDNAATGALYIALSGANADAFALSTVYIDSIPVDESSIFTVVPNTGLAVGSYAAIVTVSDNSGINESFIVNFMVNPLGGVAYVSFRYGAETAVRIIPGNKLSIEASFADPVDRQQTLIATLYKENGALIKLATCDGVIDNGFINFSADLDIPTETEKGAYVKVFVWDSQTFVPMYNAISFTNSND